MTYAMVILRADDEWEALTPAERELDELLAWWTRLREEGRITTGLRLAPAREAKTIDWRDRQPIVTDGPHLEAKESIGGLAVLEVETEEEAIAIASSWPSHRAIRLEVRRVV